MAFPELGDQVPMKVNAAGEVLRYGSKGELLFLPVMGFMLSAATVSYTHLEHADRLPQRRGCHDHRDDVPHFHLAHGRGSVSYTHLARGWQH